eukprot:9477104-Lingulodinium_polyedra.AAC.1
MVGNCVDSNWSNAVYNQLVAGDRFLGGLVGRLAGCRLHWFRGRVSNRPCCVCVSSHAASARRRSEDDAEAEAAAQHGARRT